MKSQMDVGPRSGPQLGAAGSGVVGGDATTSSVAVEQVTGTVSEVAVRGDQGKPADVPSVRVRSLLRKRLGEDVFSSWFKTMEVDGFDGTTVRVSVPVKFLRNWIQSHYSDPLLECCRAEFPEADRVEVSVRQPGMPSGRAPAEPVPVKDGGGGANGAADAGQARPAQSPGLRPSTLIGRTSAGGLEGSPLDQRYTFENFVVGASNRMAHAGATQVAETLFNGSPGFNPFYIHSAVGLGKTHLLHAIALEIRRRAPHAQVLYLTAERFRFQFVEAIRSPDPLSFKDRFRNIDVLLIDDLEFLAGQQTEQEFDHIINALLDGGKQLVVASARPPNHIERLNERMRSRLQRGLVTEIQPLDRDLRLKVLERRIAEKQEMDPSFVVSRDVMELLADRLTENGRELEGAVIRLHATWHYMKTPITLDMAETSIRDLFQGSEPRRIKIEDILKVIARHFGVSRGDLLSQRRHRSVVWPRQIGMYLAKQMTSRSLPEIGRRFGNRDHTTVLHAIRKIESALTTNPRLKDELEELKRGIMQ